MNHKIRVQPNQVWVPAAVAVVACLATWLVHWGTSKHATATTGHAQPGWSWIQTDLGRNESHEARSPSGQDLVRPPHVLRALLQAGSFAGTSSRGSWCVNGMGSLDPCLGLRERFEYHINGLGEISEAEVRALIEDEARRDVGGLLASQIMSLYDRYWVVRNHPLRQRVDMSDPGTWLLALREAKAVRREFLGEAWARAFYAEEEQELIATHERVAAGSAPAATDRDPVPSPMAGQSVESLRAERVKRFGEGVTIELEALDAKQQAFENGVSQARLTWQRLMSQGHLTDADRHAQLQSFVDATFEPVDRRRAMSLATSPAH